MKKLLILAFLLLGCFSMASYAAKPKAKHVVYIGLDGWGSYSMPKANMPTVKSLMETGCYTMQKRTVLPSSSAVNWASMFMGAGPEVHGYTCCFGSHLWCACSQWCHSDNHQAWQRWQAFHLLFGQYSLAAGYRASRLRELL